MEEFSGHGGNFFTDRWKNFQGMEEAFSWMGGKIFRAEYRLKSKGGKKFRVKTPAFFQKMERVSWRFIGFWGCHLPSKRNICA